jgi:hypothetical protein
VQHGDVGDADQLVGLIGAVVVHADEHLDVGLLIRFETNAELLVPLDGVGGFEVANFNTAAGLDVWTPRS